MALLEVPDPVAVAPPPAPFRERWIPLVAASVLILVVGGGLALVTAEYLDGSVAGHELRMDKAAAIHKLFFRE
jgi:hypothetical protein